MVNRAWRVAVVHSYYANAEPSGENLAVDSAVAAMRRAGWRVDLRTQHTDARSHSPAYEAAAAFTAATGFGRKPRIDEADIDVVHVHNTFPNFGRRWASDLHRPVVVSLHNYRPFCAAATLVRPDGSPCDLDGRRVRTAGMHACYRDSTLASAAVAMGARGAQDPLLQRADRLIALTPAMRDLYVERGCDATKIEVIPNFLPADLDPGTGKGGQGWLFVGRLSQEKGIVELARQWPADAELLRIVGSGSLANDLRGIPNTELLGRRARDEVARLMRQSRGLIFPSVWAEGLPLVYVEALAAGLPVLALDTNGVASLVEQDGTGAVATWSGLSCALRSAQESFPFLRERCRTVFEQRYAESAHLGALDRLYKRVV